MTDTFDPGAFEPVRKGRQFEDFEVGQVLEHHWGRTLTEADNVAFCTAMCCWNPMYLNAAFARAHGHPDVVINPMLVLCTAVGLSVEDLSEAGGPFLGLEACQFHRPVFPGQTIAARSTVVDKRESRSRPSMGIVTWSTEVRNDSDQLVAGYRRTNLVARRSGHG